MQYIWPNDCYKTNPILRLKSAMKVITYLFQNKQASVFPFKDLRVAPLKISLENQKNILYIIIIKYNCET